MKCAISTACFYPMPVEDALVRAAGLGFERCEVFLNTFAELKPDFLRLLKDISAAEGVEIISVHSPFGYAEPNFLYSQYTRRTEDSLLLFRRLLHDIGSVLGNVNFIFHGGLLRQQNPPAVDIDIYKKLYGFGREAGVTVCQENVNLYFLARLENIREMAAGFPDCRFTVDIKQARRSGLDPFDVLSAMGERAAHFHINDFNTEQDCLLPGEGCFDLAGFAERLREFGFGGHAVIEVYRSQSGDGERIRKAKAFVEGL